MIPHLKIWKSNQPPPGLNGLYFSRGVIYFLARRFESAVKDFDRYIRKEPKDPGAYLNRGASYLFLKDTTKALADYNKAISLTASSRKATSAAAACMPPKGSSPTPCRI